MNNKIVYMILYGEFPKYCEVERIQSDDTRFYSTHKITLASMSRLLRLMPYYHYVICDNWIQIINDEN